MGRLSHLNLTHPSHSQTSRLLTSSLSLGVPVPRPTQCMRVTIGPFWCGMNKPFSGSFSFSGFVYVSVSSKTLSHGAHSGDGQRRWEPEEWRKYRYRDGYCNQHGTVCWYLITSKSHPHSLSPQDIHIHCWLVSPGGTGTRATGRMDEEDLSQITRSK